MEVLDAGSSWENRREVFSFFSTDAGHLPQNPGGGEVEIAHKPISLLDLMNL